MVVILAAGPGARLRPLTADKPKALLPAAGRPILADLLDELPGDVTIVVGHGQRPVRAYLGEGEPWGLKIRYVEQAGSLGPGHALFQARPHMDHGFAVFPGDSWYHPDLIRRLREAPGPAMVLVPDARSGRHGVPVVEGDQVTGLLEQEDAGDRATGFCGGAYKMHRRIFEYLKKCDYSMRDAIRMDIQENGPWHLIEAKPKEYVDVIEVEDLLKVQDLLMPELEPRNDGTIEDGALVSGPVHIEEGSVIQQGAVVRGPVFIGKHCDIGPGAVLLPGTALRNRVRVEPLTLVQRSSIASNVVLGSHCRVRDAVLDNGVQVGSHVHFEAGPGTIVGADAVLGDRVTVQADGVIGRQAQVASGRIVREVPDSGRAV